MYSKYLIVIGGPTASGKTSFAIELAQHFRTVILSADSRQFYREMSIGTAKPEEAELAAAPHFFIGHLSIAQAYSVGDFEKEAMALLSSLFEEHDVVILVGGSGLYIKAICEGLDEFPDVPAAIRRQAERDYEEKGLSFLQKELLSTDPDYYRVVDLNNPHRLIRAISIYRASGLPFSSFWNQQKSPRFFKPLYLQLQWPRALLYERINRRVDKMIASGLVEEARQLLPYHQHTALQTVGYQELFDHFNGQATLEEAIENIKKNSRRYAKRQLSWYRRDGHWKRIYYQEPKLALPLIEAMRFEGLSIQQQAIGPNTYPIYAEKAYRLAFLAHEDIVVSALYFSGKYGHLAILEEPGSSTMQWLQWLIHELRMANVEDPLWLFTPRPLAKAEKQEEAERLEAAQLTPALSTSWQAFQKKHAEGQIIRYKPYHKYE
jgi:tRNA dimethylallyltransferase